MESMKHKFAKNPREGANFFSKVLFTWTIPLFKMGYEKILQMEDVFRPLNVDHSDSLGHRLEM